MLCRLDVGVPNPCVYIYACIRMITYAFCFGKKNVFRLEMKESREDFFWRGRGRGRGRTFHIEGLKTEKAREPNVERIHTYWVDPDAHIVGGKSCVSYTVQVLHARSRLGLSVNHLGQKRRCLLIVIQDILCKNVITKEWRWVGGRGQKQCTLTFVWLNEALRDEKNHKEWNPVVMMKRVRFLECSSVHVFIMFNSGCMLRQSLCQKSRPEKKDDGHFNGLSVF